LHNIFMLTELIGYIGGQNSTILYTSNGGTQWTSRNSGINQGIDGIHFSNTNTGWAVGNAGAVYKTSNAGINWVTETSNTTNELNDVYFPDINRGWAVGVNGTIIYRAGTIGIINISGIAPDEFSISQNYPNPFNPTTNIEFNIAENGFVSLKVFDITGKEISNLVNENLQRGTYKVDWSAAGLTSGVYFYTLKTASYSETKKMMLVK
ncbi:MAG TPA: T9SS type A sorting domain-containing protein, partial [Ignavibacteria bacterium]|nr:T9SS type A sorting domain-containing protein [Ignavibacteria bacterium]